MSEDQQCALCDGARRVGLLCAPCAARLTAKAPLLPHHIEGHGRGHGGAPMCLVDAWGRPHPLDEHAILGREGATLRLVTGVVSRAHLALDRDATNDTWSARDLGSHNGSSLNGAPLAGEARPIHAGDVLHLADVGLAFVPHMTPASEPALRTLTLTAAAVPQGALAFALHEHPMGGGGVLELRDGRTFELPLLQLELLQLLSTAWQRDPDAAPDVRGFVTSAYLMAVLSWDARSPGADHLKQLIRRTRVQLAGSGLGIESRRGAGYRLGRESDRDA